MITNPSLPRADLAQFRAEPLCYLAAARAELGDLFVLREEGPIFSRTPGCNGVVAAFGAERQRAVLTDIEAFAMPPTAARQLALPERLSNLNRSLHSMRGDEHAAQKRAVTAVLDGCRIDPEFTITWEPGQTIGLLTEMRALAVQLASRVMFGDDEDPALVRLLQLYFELRREAASPNATAIEHDTLVDTGRALDDALRDYIRRKRGDGVIAALANARLSEDEVVGHSNIFFISATEPVAIALAWTMLLLSQMPALRQQLRDDPPLVEKVLLESLRLLPPNAFMVRITSAPATLGGVQLPERCEVVLSPFVAHRDPRVFARPDEFRLPRWNGARPSAFDYFPFGAGGHACVGRSVAMQLMKSALAFLVARHDLVLAGDQEIDWRVHIQFMPQGDPLMLVQPTHAARGGGRLRGPVAELLRLDFASGDGVQ